MTINTSAIKPPEAAIKAQTEAHRRRAPGRTRCNAVTGCDRKTAGRESTTMTRAVPERKTETENSIAIARQYEPTQRERQAVEAYAERRQQRPPAPSLAVTSDDTATVRVAIDHPDGALGEKLLANALGTTVTAFLPGLIEQLARAGIKGKIDREAQLNFMLSLVLGTEPRDQIETMLATHMA
jgi:hypothetical protein